MSVPTNAPDADDSVAVVELNGMPAVVTDGVYQLVCSRSGMALDNGNSATAGSALVEPRDNGGNQQQWQLIKVG